MDAVSCRGFIVARLEEGLICGSRFFKTGLRLYVRNSYHFCVAWFVYLLFNQYLQANNPLVKHNQYRTSFHGVTEGSGS